MKSFKGKEKSNLIRNEEESWKVELRKAKPVLSNFLALFLIILFIFLINIKFINAHHESIVTGEVVSGVPESVSEIPGAGITSSLGEVDPNTGLPAKFSDFKEKADEFRYSEQNQSYLKKEWTKILAGNRYFGPFLFYTDKFFSFLNPFWKITFGIEFSWSLIFFFHIFLWITLAIIIYFPLKELFKNSLFGFIGGIIVASITGVFGVLTWFVNILDVIFVKLWALTIFVSIVILLLVLYGKLFKSFREESEEEWLKRSKEKIKALGKVSGEGLEEIGGKLFSGIP